VAKTATTVEAGRDDREDSLALEHVEVLADEAPEVEHDELEGDRIDDIGRKGHRGVLAYGVSDVDEHCHDRVRAQVDPERAADADPSGEGAQQSDHRPDRQRQDDEEQRVGLRAGFVEKDRLSCAEGGVHRPAQHDREARHLERPVQLGAANVKELGHPWRHRGRLDDAAGLHQVCWTAAILSSAAIRSSIGGCESKRWLKKLPWCSLGLSMYIAAVA